MTPKHLLLLSSSTVNGSGYLDYAEAEISDFIGRRKKILFVPYALQDEESYFARAGQRFQQMGYEIEPIHHSSAPQEAVERAEAIFIGGGNTFRLLNSLYRNQLLEPLRRQVEAGVPYLGSSAGSNVAAPSIRTTNDMPIVEVPSLGALDLIPFQINPHYFDPAHDSTQMGESRGQRILQYLEENETPVLAMREGAWLRVEGAECRLGGSAGGRWFARGAAPREVTRGMSLPI